VYHILLYNTQLYYYNNIRQQPCIDGLCIGRGTDGKLEEDEKSCNSNICLYIYIYLHKKETVVTRRGGGVEISFYFPFPRRRNGWWKKTPRIPYINTQHLRTHALFARVYIKCS